MVRLYMMNLMLFSNNIYWRSVIVAGILAWILGFVWYHPGVFGDIWAADPFTRTPEVIDFIKLMLVSMMISLVSAYIINSIASFCNLHGFAKGFVLSLWIGFGLIVLNMLGNLIFLNATPAIVAIDVGYVYGKILIYCLFATMWYKKSTSF